MYVLAYLKQGLGNKLFFLVRHIEKFKELKKKNKEIKTLYIVQSKSHHEKGIESENITHIFPNLLHIDWLKFIDWKEYDSLKKDAFTEFKADYDFSYKPFLELKSFLQREFKFNTEYKSLLKKYDTKNGIAVHIRLGDKFEMNYHSLKKGDSIKYVLMQPAYYVHHVQKMLKGKEGPIYIFSDSVQFAECLLKPFLKDVQIVNENFPETFYLFSKFKRSVLSDSTMTIAAIYLNKQNPISIVPGYSTDESGKITESPYVDSETFQLELDKKYILKTKKQYDEVIARCS